jgi:hypothetical protein
MTYWALICQRIVGEEKRQQALDGLAEFFQLPRFPFLAGGMGGMGISELPHGSTVQCSLVRFSSEA